jgi:hypothetical protein
MSESCARIGGASDNNTEYFGVPDWFRASSRPRAAYWPYASQMERTSGQLQPQSLRP